MRRVLACACLALSLFFAGAVSLAQGLPRVSVGPMTGPRADAAREAVSQALAVHSTQIDFIPDGDYAIVAQRLGVQGLAGEGDVAMVGREMRLDAVVVGTMERRGRQFVLRLRVLRGRDGTTLGASSWELHSVGELASIRGEIWEQLSRYFRTRSANGGRPAGSEDRSEGRAESATTSSAPTQQVMATPGLGFLTVMLGGGLSQRFWRMPVLSAGADSSGPGSIGDVAPRGYENGGYGELRAELMLLYRWSNDRAGAGISAGGAFPVGLRSRAEDPNNPGVLISLPTSAYEVWGGAAAAYRPPGGGLMRAQLGFATQYFNVDTESLPMEQRLAPVSYTGLRAAFEGVLPLFANHAWEVGALFGGEFRLTEVGADLKIRFGQNPRPTIAMGMQLGVAVRLDGITPGLGLRLVGEMIRYRTAFAGPYTVGVGSDSVDDFFRFHLVAVYSIGTSGVSQPRRREPEGGDAVQHSPQVAPQAPSASQSVDASAFETTQNADPFAR